MLNIVEECKSFYSEIKAEQGAQQKQVDF